ncbi:MAG: hypothetical protein AB7E47_12525 [Desulfovibrionaceae bacterium]
MAGVRLAACHAVGKTACAARGMAACAAIALVLTVCAPVAMHSAHAAEAKDADLPPRAANRLEFWEKYFEMPREERLRIMMQNGPPKDRLSPNSLADPAVPAPRPDPEEQQ